MKKMIFLMSTLLAVTLSACSGSSVSLDGEWTLISYGDATSPTPAIADVETTISFSPDGKFGGNVGCNSFSADYTMKGNSVRISSVISTMMFCEQTSAQESAVIGILSDKTMMISLSGSRLTLTTEDGISMIVLEKK